ncbi:hypothetical protein RRG08_025230 [Elysia crispata]|uniref:Uncharacterized protein n=1 Tax=Elysia crispata TaxID=231223 RepID=A0AAE1DUZ6_9GAST|nr:hypothetical protein RRG08_025230 [Elysia crispata]
MALIRFFALGALLGISSVLAEDGSYDNIYEYLLDCTQVIRNCGNTFLNDLKQSGDGCSSANNYLNCVKRRCPIAADYSNTLNENMREYLRSRGIACDFGQGNVETVDKNLETCRVVIDSCGNLFRADYQRSGDGCRSARSYLNCVKRNCFIASEYPDLVEYEVQKTLKNNGIVCDFKDEPNNNGQSRIQVCGTTAALFLVVLAAMRNFLVGC